MIIDRQIFRYKPIKISLSNQLLNNWVLVKIIHIFMHVQNWF